MTKTATPRLIARFGSSLGESPEPNSLSRRVVRRMVEIDVGLIKSLLIARRAELNTEIRMCDSVSDVVWPTKAAQDSYRRDAAKQVERRGELARIEDQLADCHFGGAFEPGRR